MEGYDTRGCQICGIPTWHKLDSEPWKMHICSQCHMIVNDLTYGDGSSHQAEMNPDDVAAIKSKYQTLKVGEQIAKERIEMGHEINPANATSPLVAGSFPVR